jgi:hypothetical protein
MLSIEGLGGGGGGGCWNACSANWKTVNELDSCYNACDIAAVPSGDTYSDCMGACSQWTDPIDFNTCTASCRQNALGRENAMRNWLLLGGAVAVGVGAVFGVRALRKRRGR